MQYRHSLLLSLVCLTITAAAPVLAQGAQQNGASSSKTGTTQKLASSNSSETNTQRTIDGPYRLTYTLTEIDGNRKVGTQHYTLALDAGGQEHTQMETRVPVHVGVGTAYTTVHINVILDSHLNQFQNGLELMWGVMQTSLADSLQKVGKNTADQLPPVTRDFNLYGRVLMQEDQPITLCKLDIPGSTHILEVQAELTRIR